MRHVTAQLGNTPAVCRGSCVDPRVFDRFVHGVTLTRAIEDPLLAGARRRRRLERELIELISS